MFIKDSHPSFDNQPDPAEQVWRYMDLARYLSLLDSGALHFARADQMADRWKGSFGPANVELRPSLYGEDFAALSEMFSHLREFGRQHIHMSCWHLSKTESAAMWEIYQREGRGVAVRSTWDRLTASISSSRQIYGAKAEYVNYETYFIPEGNAFDAYLHKRESFSHEREVRLLTTTGLTGPDPNDSNAVVDLGPEAPVLVVEVDLQQLVEKVFVAPDAPRWIVDVVQSVTARYGYDFDVQQSDLAADPII